jgi:hypothetical protein
MKKTIEQKYEQHLKDMREEMNQQFSQIILIIQQNPRLAHVKPKVLIFKQLKK